MLFFYYFYNSNQTEMKKIYALLFASIICSNLIFAQNDAKLLKGFDMKAANNDMKLKGIPASDQAGYLNFLKDENHMTCMYFLLILLVISIFHFFNFFFTKLKINFNHYK